MGIRRSCMLAAVLCGCGGGDEGTALEGIYALSSWTASADCGSEGQPTFEAGLYTHFFVRADRFFGEFVIQAVMCDDLESCRADAADTDTLFIGAFFFEEGSDGDGWVGARGFLDEDNACTGTLREARLTGEPGVSVRIEEESKNVTGVPLGADGECDFDAARAQAAEQPCERLEVVTGVFVEGI